MDNKDKEGQSDVTSPMSQNIRSARQESEVAGKYICYSKRKKTGIRVRLAVRNEICVLPFLKERGKMSC